jgi:hypothetical protein
MVPSAFPEVQDYPSLKKLLEVHIDMQLSDIHTILKSGCNLSVTALLLNMISGISVCFFNVPADAPMQVFSSRDRGKRFTDLLDQFYPWLGDDALPKADCVSLLYREVRNPLTHGLALDDLELSTHKIELATTRMDESQIIELENSRNRPTWLPPTIVRNPTPLNPFKIALFIPTLYWSVHRMLRNLFADAAQVMGAEALAKMFFS